MKGNLILRYRMIIVIAVTIEKFFHCIHKISFRRGGMLDLKKGFSFSLCLFPILSCSLHIFY